METIRSRALKSLATSMPVENQRVATGLQQARLMGLQRAVATSDSPTTKAEVQQAGAQQAAAAGGIAVDAAKKGVEQAEQLGQLAVADQQTAAAQDVNARKAATDALVRKNETELNALGRDLKQDIFDRRMQFAKDESGRAVMNEYQLADWAVLKSKNSQDLQNKMQKMQLAHKRKAEMLDVMHKRILQAMQDLASGRMVEQNGITMERLARAEAAMKEKARREAADAANKQAMWQTGGTILGGAIGVVGGPAGIAAGAALGGAVGSIAGAQASRLGI